jgi:two-component system sensor histidine kinase BaeS
MKTIRGRLILSHLIPVLLVTPLVVAALLYVVQTQLLIASVRAELTSQATLLAQLAYRNPNVLVDQQQARLFIDQFSPYLTSRIMLLTPDGLVLASSEATGVANLDSLITVQEFRQVQNGKIVVHTTSQEGSVQELVDVFVPVLSPDGQLLGVMRVTNELSGLDERFLQIRRLVLWILVGGLGIGVLLGWILAIQIGKPIAAVTIAVSQLTRGERLESLPEKGPQEIRELEIAFNSLVDRLRSLEAARKHLLANLVHELARPLGALRSAIQALQRGAMEEQAFRTELLTGMNEEIGRLRRLLDELSELYNQVLGTLELNRQDIAFREWFHRLLLPYQQIAVTKGLIWEETISENPQTINIDPDRMAQVIQNLVTNAIDFTPAGGSIMINSTQENNLVKIQVKDSGSGIPFEEQALIWQPFYRGTNRGRFPKGMGLGLSIAKEIVEAHDGSIELESEPGSGSSFTIKLEI